MSRPIFHSRILLEQALSGNHEARGELFEHFRPYLVVIAHRQLDERLRGRLDPSDIVQTTFLEAHRDFVAFRGEDINTLLSWLRNILANNIATAHQRHLAAMKRSARRETTFFGQDSSGNQVSLEHFLPSGGSSPSQRAMRDEAAAALAGCLVRIPETQAEAIRLRYLEGASLRQIAAQMEKTEMAVAGLLKRGLKALRSELSNFQSSALS